MPEEIKKWTTQADVPGFQPTEVCETVKVHADVGDSFMVINRSDFVPGLHRMFKGAVEEVTKLSAALEKALAALPSAIEDGEYRDANYVVTQMKRHFGTASFTAEVEARVRAMFPKQAAATDAASAVGVAVNMATDAATGDPESAQTAAAVAGARARSK